MEKWIKWTIWESFIRTIILVLLKVMGILISTIGETFYVVALLGLVQATYGFFVCRLQNCKVLALNRDVLGSILFGALGVLIDVLAIIAFMNGGEILVSTFIGTLSIIPGFFFDVIFFKQPITLRQVMGIPVAITAGYLILNAPSLDALPQMPLWVWLWFAIMFILAVNQAITQKFTLLILTSRTSGAV